MSSSSPPSAASSHASVEVTEVDSYPTTFIAIPWSDEYNPYAYDVWSALLPPSVDHLAPSPPAPQKS